MHWQPEPSAGGGAVTGPEPPMIEALVVDVDLVGVNAEPNSRVAQCLADNEHRVGCFQGSNHRATSRAVAGEDQHVRPTDNHTDRDVP